MASIHVVKEDVNGSIQDDSVQQYDVIIIGAGFSGINNLHRLRNDGLNCHVFEAGMYLPSKSLLLPSSLLIKSFY